MNGRYHVGEWLVEPEQSRLVRGSETAKLDPKAIQVLTFLASHPDDVLTKEQIIGAVWDGAFVTDEVLTTAIWGLRKALGDDAKEPRYIQTIPRRGYRLIAPVEPVGKGASEASIRWEPSPYPGLSSFSQRDAQYFFGREREIEILWTKLQERTLLGLIGPSGAGKSSLLRAGLIPAAPEGWEVFFCKPRHDALEGLRRESASEKTLWVVDQFEELFTLHDEETQGQIVELLGKATESGVHVVLSMRDDFLIRCHGFPELEPVFKDLTPVRPLEGAALRRALTEPARAAGYRFEDEALVAEILTEVSRERGALPLLAFAASKLWERRDREGRRLTREAYLAIGGVAGALAQHAEETLAGIGAESEPIVREIFRNLTTASGTRVPTKREELLTVFPEQEEASRVLGELIDARLLTSSEGEVELIHESLLTAWPRLVRWRMQDGDGAVLRDQLRQAAQTWEERGRPEDLLWTGTSFREYELWRERYGGGLSESETQFARAMKARAKRRKRRRNVGIAAALLLAFTVAAVTSLLWQRSEQARRKAEAEQLLAVAHDKLDESPTEALAYVTKSLELADSPESRLVMLDVLAAGPPATVIDVKQLHEIHGTRNNEGSPIGELLEDDTLDRYVHGVEFSGDGAWAALEGFEVIEIVSRDAKTWLSLERFSAGAGRVRAAFDPSGRYLFGARDGELRAWSVPEFRLLDKQALPSGLTAIVATKASAFTASRTKDGSVVLTRYTVGSPPVPMGQVDGVGSYAWNLAPSGQWAGFARGGEAFLFSLEDPGAGPRTVARHGEPIEAIWFDQTGDRLLAVDESEKATIWSVEAARQQPLAVLDANGVAFFVFDDGGDRLAGLWTKPRKEAAVWERTPPIAVTPTRLSAVSPGAYSLFINGANFTRDGRWLAMGQVNGAVFVPLARVGPRILTNDAPEIRGLDFTSDSRHLVAVDRGGHLAVWDLQDGNAKITPKVPVTTFPEIEIAPNDEWAVVGAVGGAVVISLEGGSMRRLEGFEPSTWIGDVAIDDAGMRVAAAGNRGPGRDKGIRIWELDTGDTTFLGPIDGAEDGFDQSIFGLEFLPDGRLVSSGTSGLRLWNPKDGSNRVIATTCGPCGLAVFGEGRYVVSLVGRAGDVRVQVTDLETETSSVLSNNGAWIQGPVAVDPSEQFAVTTGQLENSLAIWPLSGGEPHLLAYHDAMTLAISPDGRWIAASSPTEETLRLWPVPDISKTPLQAFPHDALIVKLKSLTNVRVVRDADAPSGWRIDIDPFPGWETAPTW